MRAARASFIFRWVILLVAGWVLWKDGKAGFDPSGPLLQAFSGRCDSYGPMNAQSFADAGVLKATLEGIRDDEDCKALSRVIDQITAPTFADLFGPSDRARQDLRVGTQISDLEMALQAEQARGDQADALYIETLRAELVRLRKDRILQRSRETEEQSRLRDSTLISFYQYSSLFFNSIAESQKCYEKYPNVLAQTGAQLMALSSGAVGSAAGAALLASGNFISGLVEFTRTRKVARSIRRLVKDSVAEAVGCGFEAISKSYCEARDLLSVIDQVSRTVRPTSQEIQSEKSGWEGVRVVARDLGSFSTWVLRVAAGSTPVNVGQSSEQKAGVDLRATFDKFRLDLAASVAITPPRSTSAEVQNLIDRLVGLVQQNRQGTGSSSSVRNPLQTFFAGDAEFCGPLAFFWCPGDRRRCQLTDTIRTCQACVENACQPTPPSRDEVAAKATMMATLLQPEVAREATKVQEQDAESVLEAYFGSLGTYRSPRNFLVGTVEFLKRVLESERSRSEKKGMAMPFAKVELIQDTIRRLEEADRMLHLPLEVPPGSDKRAEASRRLADLAGLLAPENNSTFIAMRVEPIAQRELDRLTREGKIDETLKTIMELSYGDSLGLLTSRYETLAPSRESARKARDKNEQSLRRLSEVFGKGFRNYLDRLRDSGKAELLDFACVQSLLSPSYPRLSGTRWSHVGEVCRDRVFKGLYGLEIRMKDWSRKPYEDRACVLYDYYRRAKIESRKLESRGGGEER